MKHNIVHYQFQCASSIIAIELNGQGNKKKKNYICKKKRKVYLYIYILYEQNQNFPGGTKV